ncbi:hypothetical protein KIF59_17455 [Enterobacter cloacae subsp. cloacae]|nr:hypothetical protein [Enterobacter cloacae subsp. cloacae]
MAATEGQLRVLTPAKAIAKLAILRDTPARRWGSVSSPTTRHGHIRLSQCPGSSQRMVVGCLTPLLLAGAHREMERPFN